MLISHTKKFIFTKTTKTASTSVELMFEPFCLNKDQQHLLHCRKELVSTAGVVGARGKYPKETTWYNHMSLKKIYDLLDPGIFQNYFKFTTVRNPYHKMISLFFYLEKRQLKMLKTTPREKVPFFDINPNINCEVSRFRDWLSTNKIVADRSMYFLNGKPAVDFFVRFESLTADLEILCSKLDIPKSILANLPHIKPGIGRHKLEVAQFYDEHSKNIIEKMFEWEINCFGYELK